MQTQPIPSTGGEYPQTNFLPTLELRKTFVSFGFETEVLGSRWVPNPEGQGAHARLRLRFPPLDHLLRTENGRIRFRGCILSRPANESTSTEAATKEMTFVCIWNPLNEELTLKAENNERGFYDPWGRSTHTLAVKVVPSSQIPSIRSSMNLRSNFKSFLLRQYDCLIIDSNSAEGSESDEIVKVIKVNSTGALSQEDLQTMTDQLW